MPSRSADVDKDGGQKLLWIHTRVHPPINECVVVEAEREVDRRVNILGECFASCKKKKKMQTKSESIQLFHSHTKLLVHLHHFPGFGSLTENRFL